MDGKRLEVEVDGSPTPSVQWFKNGQEVKEEFSDGHKHALVVSPADTGSNYSITVKSGSSEQPNDQNSGNVVIRSDPVLKDVTVHLNSEVILTVNTSDYNKSDITWSKESATPATAESRTASYRLQVTQISEVSTVPPTGIKEPVIKPKIKRGLSNISALQNQTDTELLVETETSSESTVKWFIDDIEIVDIDTRYKIVNDKSSGTHKLIVKEANEGTAGIYKCKVANEAGYDETSAEFTVSSKPEFMQELEDREALEGETISMDVVIAGNPKPDITWLRNGVDVTSDETILIEKESDTVYILTIEKVTKNSTGSYECVIKNRVGETRSKGLLSLLTEPSFSKDLGEVTGGKVGEDIVLEVELDGNPKPSVTWYKDGQPITTPGMSETTDNKFRLHFKSLELEDGAEYYCTAKNRIGEKTSRKIRFTVETEEKVYEKQESVVEEESKEPVTKPKIKRGLSNISALENQKNTELLVEVESSSDCSLKWFIDDVEIVETDSRYEIASDKSSGVSKLIVKEANEGTAGVYKCTVANEAGSSETSTAFTVESKPKFTKELKDQEAREGETISMDVVIAGTPKPEVKWLRNGVEVTADESILIEKKSDSEYVLKIKKVNSKNAGTYECVIENRAGETRSKGLLSLLTEPSFSKDLGEITNGVVGENVALEVVVEGNPKPSVTWYKDGKQISTSVVSENKDNKFRLRFEPVELEDAAEYYCVAKNKIGEKTSNKIRFTVETGKKEEPKVEEPVVEEKKKPTLVRGLSDTSISPNDTLVLKVTAEGNPEPTVTWCKDGVPLGTIGPDGSVIGNLPSNVSITKDGAVHTLTVKNVSPSDAATYTCNMKNDAGETSSAAQVTVTEGVQKPTILGLSDAVGVIGGDLKLEVTVDGAPAPTVTWLKDGKEMDKGSQVSDGNTHKLLLTDLKVSDEGDYTCRATNSSGDTDSVAKVKIAATLPTVSGLEDTKADAGVTVFLKATVTGHPVPSVTWMKDGEELVANSNVLISEEGDVRRVTIRNVSEKDVGKYEIKVKNAAGESSASAKIEIGESAPMILQELPSNIKLIEGNVLVLQAKVSGSPLPKVKWMKDGSDLIIDERMDQVMRPDGTVILTIRDVRVTDQGGYELVVVNKQGQVTNHSSVTVAARDVLPKFVKELTRAEVEIGQSAKMEAKVIGTPSPDIKWYKDEIPLKTSERIRTNRTEDGTLTIEIDNVTEEDLGLYKILASNQAGEKISIAPLRTPRIELPTKPEFVVHLLDGDFEEDSQLVLTCKVRGSPNPVIKWLRDGGELIPDGDRIKSTMDEDGHITLTIENIQMDEAGKYVCSAMNSEGRTRTAAQINTFHKRPGSERSKTPKKPVEEMDRRSKFQPSDFEIPDRVMPDREPIHVSSESHYQNGPDTMLLQHRDPDYPLRVREYLRVGARESPYLANNLRSSYWGDADIGYGFSPQVAVRERRRYSAIVKEIQTEVTTGDAPTRGRRFFSPHHPELSSEYRSSSASRTATGGSSFLSSSSTLASSSNYRSTTSSSPFKYSRS